MKKIQIIVLSVIFAFISFFTFRVVTNEIIISLYEKDIYSNELIKSLYLLNFNEPYIVYYNNGNLNFKQKEYDTAIKNYKISLEKNPPKSRVCDIRINLSLATLYNIKATDKDTILAELKKAREYLYENGCANEQDNNGSSEEAEELEEEIKELEKEVSQGSGGNSNSNQQSNENNKPQDNYENIEEQIKEKQNQNNASRSEDLDRSSNMGNYEYYKGKKW